MRDDMYEEIYRIHSTRPLFLHCCPWWMLRSAMVREVSGYTFQAANGNLSAFFIGGKIPVALRDAIRSYDNGYQFGLSERPKKETNKHGH